MLRHLAVSVDSEREWCKVKASVDLVQVIQPIVAFAPMPDGQRTLKVQRTLEVGGVGANIEPRIARVQTYLSRDKYWTRRNAERIEQVVPNPSSTKETGPS